MNKYLITGFTNVDRTILKLEELVMDNRILEPEIQYLDDNQESMYLFPARTEDEMVIERECIGMVDNKSKVEE